MLSYNIPDYTKYFEHKHLDKVHGQPTIENIVKLLKQSKRNAQSVPTTFGGGQLGYLAFYFTPAEYLSIHTATAFARPTDPGVFTPTQNGGIATRAGGPIVALTAADIATQQVAHDQQKREYNEVQAVELVLRKQIIMAIDDEYLQPLRDPVSDTIQCSILDIFSFLKTTYGRLSPGQLKEKEMLIDNFVYDPATNVDTVFNAIQAFNELCVLLNNAKSDTQLVTYAYLIFQKNGIFMEGLKSWNSKASNTKTFSEFKKHMRQEYSDLQDVGGLTINNSLTNQVNMIQELKDHQELMTNNLKSEFNSNLMETFRAFNMIDENQMQIANNNSNNSYDHEEHKMLTMKGDRDPLVELLMKQITSMQTQLQNLSTNTGSSKFTKSDEINPKTGQTWKRYCWSCGCCPHWGKNCPNKKEGHKNEATFKNRMEGSNKNCK